MIIEFNSKIYFFVEDFIDLMIDHFVDILFKISTKNDSSRFFLIQITNETR
jgi:hypothetical protein